MSDLISREDAVALVIKAIHGTDNKEIKEYLFDGLRKQMWSLPSAESTGAMDEAIQKYIKDGYMQPIGEDLISRQDAKRIVSGDGKYFGRVGRNVLHEMWTDICSLPSADKPTGWIPVSERLPEKGERVLVTVWNDVTIAWRNIYGGWESAEDMYEKGDVTAWMPLPTPYKGGDTE